MFLPNKFNYTISSFLLFLLMSCPIYAQITTNRDTILYQTFKNDAEYFHINIPSIPLNYYVYKFKMSDTNKLDAVFANNKIPDFKRQKIQQVISKNNLENNKVIAAINGDFFSYKTGELEGFQVNKGNITYGHVNKTKYGVNIDFNNHIQLDSVYFTGSLITQKEKFPILGVNTLKYINTQKSIVLFDSHINLEHISPHQYSFVLIKREQNNYHFIKEMALPPKSLDKHHYLLAINMPNTKSIISQLKKNQTFIIKTSLNSKQDNTPLHLKSHISGGTPLIYHGVNVTQNIQNLASYRSKAHPRTALGINQKENTITWIVVDGRSEFSKGVNYTDLAQLFVENNCDSAINLDGGGSSVLWLNGEIKNNPSDKKGTRPCLNYLLLSQ